MLRVYLVARVSDETYRVARVSNERRQCGMSRVMQPLFHPPRISSSDEHQLKHTLLPGLQLLGAVRQHDLHIVVLDVLLRRQAVRVGGAQCLAVALVAETQGALALALAERELVLVAGVIVLAHLRVIGEQVLI